MTDLHTLAERCLTAQADETRAILEDAWNILDDGSHVTHMRGFTFTRLLDNNTQETFLAAAMMLARDGREVEQVLYSALMKMQFLEVPYDNFRRDIPRYVTAAALLARAE